MLIQRYGWLEETHPLSLLEFLVFYCPNSKPQMLLFGQLNLLPQARIPIVSLSRHWHGICSLITDISENPITKTCKFQGDKSETYSNSI